MPVTITWHEIAIRLAWTVVAGVLIGLNRTEHGRPAGLRTTLLVCLAASLSMIQANLLMDSVGKAKDSFVVLDLMRLPLGILSGMGFIGAGAILRRGKMVLGVTTAATLWFVTVLGLCFGGGQIGIGAVALVIALATLWGLKLIEKQMHQDQRARISVLTTNDGPDENDIRFAIVAAGYHVASLQATFDNESRRRQVHCDVSWSAKQDDREPPDLLKNLARRTGVLKLRWKL